MLGVSDGRNVLWVSLISRCAVAIVPNTSEDSPERETPVNTVIARVGRSTGTSRRLVSRVAPDFDVVGVRHPRMTTGGNP